MISPLTTCAIPGMSKQGCVAPCFVPPCIALCNAQLPPLRHWLGAHPPTAALPRYLGAVTFRSAAPTPGPIPSPPKLKPSWCPPPHAQELILDCQLHPGAVPLLARLPRLDRLALHLNPGRGTDTWCTPGGGAAAAALMPLLLYGPNRPRVHVYGTRWAWPYREAGAEGQERRQLNAALRRGVRWLQGTLRGMGRDPCAVQFIKGSEG